MPRLFYSQFLTNAINAVLADGENPEPVMPEAERYLRKSKRIIRRAFIHSSATKPSMDIGRDEIDDWHKQRGWSGIGYHLVIRRDGTHEIGRDVDVKGAHTGGHNHDSIGVVLVGGVSNSGKPEANFTDMQFRTLSRVVDELLVTYPGISILGHRDVAATSCPSFNAQRWIKTGEVLA